MVSALIKTAIQSQKACRSRQSEREAVSTVPHWQRPTRIYRMQAGAAFSSADGLGRTRRLQQRGPKRIKPRGATHDAVAAAPSPLFRASALGEGGTEWRARPAWQQSHGRPPLCETRKWPLDCPRRSAGREQNTSSAETKHERSWPRLADSAPERPGAGPFPKFELSRRRHGEPNTNLRTAAVLLPALACAHVQPATFPVDTPRQVSEQSRK